MRSPTCPGGLPVPAQPEILAHPPLPGFGPGAHSDFGGVRYAYEKDLEAYIHGVKNHMPLLSESERIPPLDRDTEWLMLGLRTVQGPGPPGI